MGKIGEKLEALKLPLTITVLSLLLLGVAVYAGIWIYSNIVTVTISEAENTLNQPADVSRYHNITFTGNLKWSNGTKISGATVFLEYKNASMPDWVLIGSNMTDVDGDYSITWNATIVGTFDFRTRWWYD